MAQGQGYCEVEIRATVLEPGTVAGVDREKLEPNVIKYTSLAAELAVRVGSNVYAAAAPNPEALGVSEEAASAAAQAAPAKAPEPFAAEAYLTNSPAALYTASVNCGVEALLGV